MKNVNYYKDIPFIVFGDHTRVLKFINFSFAKGADGTQVILSNNKRMPQTLFYYSLKSLELSNYHYARHFKFLKEEKILLPTEELSKEFDAICSPIFEKIKNLRDQIYLLEKSKEILLPRLMTGRINFRN